MSYKKFYYSFPTMILFGKDCIKDIEKYLKNSRNVLLIYSSDFIKKNGIYNSIIFICDELNISIVEINNCRPNPTYEYVRNISEKLPSIDYIIAVGGGSVIDTAKTISLYIENKVNFLTKLINNELQSAKIPIGVVSTIPASGSECNSSFVLNAGKDFGKIARANNSVRPVFAVLDPNYLVSLSKFQLKCAIADVFSHLLEQFFALEENVDFIDGLIYANLRSLIDLKSRFLKKLDIDDLANLMLISTHSLSYVLSIGRTCDWNVHAIEHALHSHVDLIHSIGVAVIYPSYLKLAKENEIYKKRLINLGINVFRLTKDDSPDSTIKKIEEFFSSMQLLTDTAINNFKKIKIDQLEHALLGDGPIGKVLKVDEIFLRKIMEMICEDIG